MQLLLTLFKQWIESNIFLSNYYVHAYFEFKQNKDKSSFTNKAISKWQGDLIYTANKRVFKIY